MKEQTRKDIITILNNMRSKSNYYNETNIIMFLERILEEEKIK